MYIVHNYRDIYEQRKLILEFPDNLSHCQNFIGDVNAECENYFLATLQNGLPQKKCVRLSNMNLFQKISFQFMFPLLFLFLNYRSRPIFFLSSDDLFEFFNSELTKMAITFAEKTNAQQRRKQI